MNKILKLANTSLILSIATIFIKKWNLFGLPLKISDVFLIISTIAILILIFKKEVNLNLFKNVFYYIIIFICILLVGSISSLIIFKELPILEVVIDYSRFIACIFIFIEIIILSEMNHKLLNYILLAFLASLIVVPITYLFPGLISSGLLLDSSRYRFAGLFNDPNYYANFYIIPTIIILVIFLKEEKKYLKILFFVAFSLSTGFLIWTGSRSGLLGVGIAFILFVLFKFKFTGFAKSFIVSLYIGIAIIAGLFLVPNIAKHQVEQRAKILVSDTGNITLTKGQGRSPIWKQSFDNFIKNPLGYGPGYSSIINIVDGTEHRASHSIIFEILLMGGVPLTILCVIIIFKGIILFYKNNFKNYFLICALAGVISSSLFIDSTSSRWIWILIAIIISSYRLDLFLLEKNCTIKTDSHIS